MNWMDIFFIALCVLSVIDLMAAAWRSDREAARKRDAEIAETLRLVHGENAQKYIDELGLRS